MLWFILILQILTFVFILGLVGAVSELSRKKRVKKITPIVRPKVKTDKETGLIIDPIPKKQAVKKTATLRKVK